MVGRNPRHILNESCKTDKRLANFLFYIQHDGQTVQKTDDDLVSAMTTSTTSYYSQTDAGQSWIYFGKLAAGTYKLRTGKFGNVNYSGSYSVLMQAFAHSEALTLA